MPTPTHQIRHVTKILFHPTNSIHLLIGAPSWNARGGAHLKNKGKIGNKYFLPYVRSKVAELILRHAPTTRQIWAAPWVRATYPGPTHPTQAPFNGGLEPTPKPRFSSPFRVRPSSSPIHLRSPIPDPSKPVVVRSIFVFCGRSWIVGLQVLLCCGGVVDGSIDEQRLRRVGAGAAPEVSGEGRGRRFCRRRPRREARQGASSLFSPFLRFNVWCICWLEDCMFFGMVCFGVLIWD